MMSDVFFTSAGKLPAKFDCDMISLCKFCNLDGFLYGDYMQDHIA